MKNVVSFYIIFILSYSYQLLKRTMWKQKGVVLVILILGIALETSNNGTWISFILISQLRKQLLFLNCE